jgi:hypothetical protein
MAAFSSSLVSPLDVAQSDFLEVPVSRFSLRRRDQGSELALCFSRKSPAIWKRQAKHELQRMIPDFGRKAARKTGSRGVGCATSSRSAR